MPRRGRLHIPGGLYHVIGRGIERCIIFNTTDDKKDFLSRLEIGLRETGYQCLAWALMNNHYHLLIRASNVPLAYLMQKLLSGYAVSFNKKHFRTGYLYQNRYKSILCDEQNYFLELIRYIHLNPVRANLIRTIKQLNQYPWTGHSAVLGHCERKWQAIEEVIASFSDNKNKAIQLYQQFIVDGFEQGERPELSGGKLTRSIDGWANLNLIKRSEATRLGDERILGDSDFVEKILNQDSIHLEKQTKHQHNGWNLEKIIHYICNKFSVNPANIYLKGRNNTLSLVKALICYYANKELNISTTVIAQRLNISQAAVSKNIAKAICYLRTNNPIYFR